MKTKIYKKFFRLTVTIFGLFVASNVFAQAPDSINYNSIIRGNQGEPLPNRVVSVKISIIDSNDAVKYLEEFESTTDENGYLNILFGNSNSFDTIRWEVGGLYLKREFDLNGDNVYDVEEKSEILGVPFVQYAARADSAFKVANFLPLDSSEISGYVLKMDSLGELSWDSLFQLPQIPDSSELIIAYDSTNGYYWREGVVISNIDSASNKDYVTIEGDSLILKGLTVPAPSASNVVLINAGTDSFSFVSVLDFGDLPQSADTNYYLHIDSSGVGSWEKIDTLPDGGQVGQILLADKSENIKWVYPGEPTYELYQDTLGGRICKISDDGTHGLVVYLDTLGYGNWFEVQEFINDPNNYKSAAKEYNDWRLPTADEARSCFYNFKINRDLPSIPGGSYNRIWTSTEYDPDYPNDDVNPLNAYATKYWPDDVKLVFKDTKNYIIVVRTF